MFLRLHNEPNDCLAWLGLAGQARRGRAWCGGAWRGKAGQGGAGGARLGVAWPGEARQGTVRHGMAWSIYKKGDAIEN